MTDATQRVAAALRKHFPEELAYSARCSCGKEFEYDDDGNWPWADHAAEAAIDALQLTEVRLIGTPGKRDMTPHHYWRTPIERVGSSDD